MKKIRKANGTQTVKGANGRIATNLAAPKTPASSKGISLLPPVAAQKVFRGKPSLATTHPDLCKELVNPEDGLKYSAGANVRVEWFCNLHNSYYTWSARISHRALSESGCGVCSGRVVLPGTNDLATTHSDLCKELVNPEDGFKYSAGASSVKVDWFCNLHGVYYAWSTTIVSRTNMMSGCGVCSNQVVLRGVNDLATTHPDLCKELVNPEDGFRYSAGSGVRVEWFCNKHNSDYTWSATIAKRAGSNRGCGVCAGQVVLPGTNDLATTHPDLCKELVDPEDGFRYSAGSDTKVEWFCDLHNSDYTWPAAISNRAGKGYGCGACSGQVVLVGTNDLATTHPDLCKELVDQSDGYRYTAGSSCVKIDWFCDKHESDYTWSTVVAHRTLNSSGCGVCSNQVVLRGSNDLATTHPDLCKELVNLEDGFKYTAGSGAKVKWFCDLHDVEYVWTTTISSRTGARSGCGKCAKSGYDPTKPGFLYVLSDLIPVKKRNEDCVQFGISNVIKDRLDVHKRSGFTSAPLLVVTSNSGALIRALEKELIAEQKHRSIPTCTDSGIKFDGSTEAFVMGSPEADAFLTWILNTASANPDFEKVTAPYLRPVS
jgi:hypothetical protein